MQFSAEKQGGFKERKMMYRSGFDFVTIGTNHDDQREERDVCCIY